MINKFTLAFSKAILILLLFVVMPSIGLAQGRKKLYGELAHANSLGVDPKVWSKYYEKSVRMMEDLDTKSILNYIVFTAGGNVKDNKAFGEFVYEHTKKDVELLMLKIG